MVAEHAHNMLNEFMAQECSAGVGSRGSKGMMERVVVSVDIMIHYYESSTDHPPPPPIIHPLVSTNSNTSCPPMMLSQCRSVLAVWREILCKIAVT